MGKCYDNPENDKDNNAVQNTWKTGKEAFKQKTLEEAAEMYVLGGIYLNEQEKQQTEIAFYEGANYQAEKMYSEKDLKQFAFECVANFLSNSDNKVEMKLVDVIIDRLDAQFEQFKKK